MSGTTANTGSPMPLRKQHGSRAFGKPGSIMSQYRAAPRSQPRCFGVLPFVICLLVPALSRGQPNPWPFDLDPQDTANPAYVEEKLAELGTDLPGLPPGQLEARSVDLADLYFFTDVVDALERAAASGPGEDPAWDRVPQSCVEHARFSVPNLLVPNPSLACQGVNTRIGAALEHVDETCLEVEFPETFVFRQTPGAVTGEYLSSFEGLISYAGEALTHVEYPSGLLPDDFVATARRVIAKIRHDPLQAQLQSRLDAYASVLGLLQANTSCFDSVARQSLATTIGTLVDELTAVRSGLNTLYSEGLAQAADDRAAVEAQGRVRPELLHPALSDRERELLAFYIGGIYWRMRGAGLSAYPPDPGQGTLRRYLYVFYPYQAIADLCAGSDSARVGSTTFIQENWGYADWMDMGRSPGNDKYADLVEMTNRGKRQILMVEPLMADRGYDTRALVAGGLHMGPCYFYAWDVLRWFVLGEDLQDPYMWFLEGPTAVGEFCMGASLGLGYARTMLWGKPRAGCVPDCAGRVCGPDGCGGVCGACGAEQTCAQGQCMAADAGTPDAGTSLADVGTVAPVDASNTGDAWAGSDLATNDSVANTGVDAAVSGGDADDRSLACVGEPCDPPTPSTAGCQCRTSVSRPGILFLLGLLGWRCRRTGSVRNNLR
ncbi:MAG: hypothetical protein ABIJ09_04375 [Pseudomonadota bacterium]